MANLTTDLNTSPFYDDFDESKNYYRILFRPSTAVQARELTQIQTQLQDQIKKNSSYLFKNGAIIDGCAISYIPKFSYVRVKDFFNGNTALTVAAISNNYLVTNSANTTNAVRAIVEIPKRGYENNYPATNRLYLRYISTGIDGSNNEISTFQSTDQLFIYNENQDKLGTLDANNLFDTINVITSNATVDALGEAYGVAVGDGLIYQKGFFINVEPHIITVNDYTSSPNTYVVGFETTESIATPEQDDTLYDNSIGSPNRNAPGAHRLKLSANLISKLRADTANDKNFFAITEFDSEQPTEQNTGEETLNKILETMANRTNEESGDYVVSPFSVEPVAHGSNTSLFSYSISPGIMYVKGYRKEKINSFRIDTTKANTTREAQAQIVTANFGNYAMVDEVGGVFDFDNVDEVVIYDTPQNCISEYEGVSSAPSGSIVGYANVRGFQYNSGNKGSNTAKYRLYLFNVRMSTGKSFANDAKSFYATSSFGNAKADIVLESNGSAQIKDASSNRLVFPIGAKAVKRLRDSGGVNDTQFVTRDIASATIAANGVATFTINSPANGGSERLNASVGALSDTGEQEFNIMFSNNAYSANLSGTVNLNNANNLLLAGTSTTFETDFVVGELIRINTGSGFELRHITEISNNTLMAIDSDVATSNTTAKYQKYFPAGHVVNTSDFGGSITVLSNTQFTVDTGIGTLDSGTQTIYAEYPILRSSAVQTAKNLKSGRFVKIDCSNNAASTTGPWDLGVCDLVSISNIYIGTTYANTNPERSAWFSVDNGQRDSYYDHARLVLKSQYRENITSNTKILVELSYFNANTTGGIGFFSVDSYPIDDANTANTTAITTGEIPVFYSSTTDQRIDLRNSVDFRPRKYNTASDTTTIASATINPVVSNTSFSVSGSGQYVIDPDTNFQADLEYYLPRVDLIVMNALGDVSVRTGVPSENPIEPINEGDTSIIARADVSAYPSLSVREADAIGRRDIAVKTSIRTNRRYTMKDTGELDKRITRMEYYTTLNLLEQRAKDLIIPDENGVDRFKNGIFADPFRSHLLGKVDDIEYSISIDTRDGVARPKFKTHDIDTKYNSSESTGITRTGRYLTRPYTHVNTINQRYATKVRNCVESVWQWNGNVDLYPTYDHFRDETLLPNININLDLSAPWEEFVNSPFATNFGDWRTTSTESEVITSGGIFGSVATATSTTTTSERIIDQMEISGVTNQTYNFGDYVSDFAVNPYMRSRIVSFIATGIKPNTTVHVFFDGVLVDEHCAPGILSGATNVPEGREDLIIERTEDFGSTLRTDSTGVLYGQFRIPSGEFRVGDRRLMITDIEDLDTESDASLTAASAVFTASSISVNKRSATLSTKQPTLVSSSTTEVTRATTVVDIPVVVTPPITTDFRNTTEFMSDGTGGNKDPIAQTFKVVVPESVSGMYITKVGVFFKTKSNVAGVTAYIAEVTQGTPDTSNIVTKAYLPAANVSVSTDSTSETTFEFDTPTYLSNLKEYALVIKPDGNSPEYTIWCSETGEYDIDTGEQVYSNPYSGVLFISANFSSWTSKQTEDLKFKVYRAEFETGTGTAIFDNEDDDYLTIDGLTKANTTYRVEVGDAVVKLDSSNAIISDSANTEYCYGTVQVIDEANDKLYIDGSTGTFVANGYIQIHRAANNTSNVSTFSNTTLIATTKVVSVDNLEYNAVVPRFATMSPMGTSISYNFLGTDSSYNTDGTFTQVIGETEREFSDKPRFAVSKTNEVTNTIGEKTTKFKLTLNNNSKYLSPVVDLSRKSSLLIQNIINDDATNEHTRYGNAITKYISRNVTLDENIGDAEDLNVYIGAYRPSGTDIKVYAKIIGSDDGDVFDEKLWTELTPTSGSSVLYSSTINNKDYKEFSYTFPTSVGETVGSATTAYTSNGIVQYARSDGSIIVGFKTFCFKIVLLGESSHRVPHLNDIRALALQK